LRCSAAKMNSNPFSGRPPTRRLSERQKNAIRVVGGIGFIAFGVLFAVVRNIDYAPDDYRGSDAYHFAVGALGIAMGIWALLSVRYPRLRGPWGRRDQ
jgi:hypothetical protein